MDAPVKVSPAPPLCSATAYSNINNNKSLVQEELSHSVYTDLH